jgi:hypothetical protein
LYREWITVLFVLVGLGLGTFVVVGAFGEETGQAGDMSASLAASQERRFGGDMVRAQGNYSIAEARSFSHYPLYALGDRYNDLPLVALVRANAGRVQNEPVRQDNVSFIYGLCESIQEQACTPPLSVQVWNGCERNRASYDPNVIVPDEETVIRGVPATFFEDWTRLELYTGTATVVLFAFVSDPAVLRDAAEKLRPVNGLASAAAKLPSPVAGIMAGTAAACA